MVRLTCPRCATTFQPPEGVTPSCPSCGYSPGGAAGVPSAPPAATPPRPFGAAPYTAPPMAPTYGYPGQPPPPQAYAPGPVATGAPRTNGMATASLVMGLLGICVFPIFSILAIVFGFMAKNQIKERREGGEGMATAGIVLGFVALALTVIFLVFFFSILRAF